MINRIMRKMGIVIKCRLVKFAARFINEKSIKIIFLIPLNPFHLENPGFPFHLENPGFSVPD